MAKRKLGKVAGKSLVSQKSPTTILLQHRQGQGLREITDGAVTLVRGEPYETSTGIIPLAEIYHVDGMRGGAGPWLGEADKIAWRDPESGYECIILRASIGGYLSGYVGVPKAHPLWGFDHRAIPPELGIDVHGGLTYSKICDAGPSPQRRLLESEARRICHVPDRRSVYAKVVHGSDYRVQDEHAWWFGFDCNHAYDLVPDRAKGRPFLSAELGAEYRDEAYVHNEVLNLAAQLQAIEHGDDKPPRKGPSRPPLGLDPAKGAEA